MKTLSTILVAAIGFTLATAVGAADNSALAQPVKSVFDHYVKIQTALAKESMDGVGDEATNIVKALEGAAGDVLPAEVAKAAKALAEAKNLKAARKEFKPLSESLIKYLTDEKIATGKYYEVYCAEIKASWLQDADKTVRNPYLGEKSKCGVVLTVH